MMLNDDRGTGGTKSRSTPSSETDGTVIRDHTICRLTTATATAAAAAIRVRRDQSQPEALLTGRPLTS